LDTTTENETLENSAKGNQKSQSEDEENEQKNGTYPLISADYLVDRTEHRPQVDHYSNTLLSAQRPMDTPALESIDSSYHPSETPRSRREFQTTRIENPVNRDRAISLSQDLEN